MCSTPEKHALCGKCRHTRGEWEDRGGGQEADSRAAVAAGHAQLLPPLLHHAGCAGLPAAQPGLLEEAGSLQPQVQKSHWRGRYAGACALPSCRAPLAAPDKCRDSSSVCIRAGVASVGVASVGVASEQALHQSRCCIRAGVASEQVLHADVHMCTCTSLHAQSTQLDTRQTAPKHSIIQALACSKAGSSHPAI